MVESNPLGAKSIGKRKRLSLLGFYRKLVVAGVARIHGRRWPKVLELFLTLSSASEQDGVENGMTSYWVIILFPLKET